MAVVLLLAPLAMATDATPAWIAAGIAPRALLASLFWLAVDPEPVRSRLGHRGALNLGWGALRREYPTTARLRRSVLVVAGCFAVVMVASAVTVPGSAVDREATSGVSSVSGRSSPRSSVREGLHSATAQPGRPPSPRRPQRRATTAGGTEAVCGAHDERRGGGPRPAIWARPRAPVCSAHHARSCRRPGHAGRCALVVAPSVRHCWCGGSKARCSFGDRP